MTATAVGADYVGKPEFRLLSILGGLSTRNRRLYAFPTQDKLCALLERLYGRAMSRRTLNRHLGALEAAGYLRRRRRHRRGRTGQLELHSTLYELTRKACRYVLLLADAVLFLLPRGGRRRDRVRCATSGTTSETLSQDYPPPPPKSGGRRLGKEEALSRLAKIRRDLLKR